MKRHSDIVNLTGETLVFENRGSCWTSVEPHRRSAEIAAQTTREIKATAKRTVITGTRAVRVDRIVDTTRCPPLQERIAIVLQVLEETGAQLALVPPGMIAELARAKDEKQPGKLGPGIGACIERSAAVGFTGSINAGAGVRLPTVETLVQAA